MEQPPRLDAQRSERRGVLAFTMLLNSYRKREGVSLMKHVATMIARETVEEAMNYVTLNQGGQEHDGRDAKV